MNSKLPNSRLDSTNKLSLFLKDIISDPHSFLAHPIAACLDNQTSLAAFDDPTLGIRGCALNTLKAAAREVPGGFVAIDNLRTQAFSKLHAARQPVRQKTTRAILQETVAELSTSISLYEGDLLLLTQMLELALRQGRQYAIEGTNQATIERCRREQNDIRDMMTLGRLMPKIPPSGDSPVRLKLVASNNDQDS